jgi:hypothetical protein
VIVKATMILKGNVRTTACMHIGRKIPRYVKDGYAAEFAGLRDLHPKWPQLFDHLVGARKERWWYGEAKRLCGLKINRQLEPSWLNDWQFGRLLTF